MQFSKLAAICLAVGAMTVGCTSLPSQVNLKQAADAVQFRNITTGDGTFENYTATDYVASREIGIAVGIPFIGKLIELYPMQSDEEQLAGIARMAKQGNSSTNAMINVTPPTDFYTGFPFIFVGIYVDSTSGTGIAAK